MPHSREDFIGAWSLADWRIEYSDGSVTQPFGANAQGYILYAHSGIMTASICKAERPKFSVVNARNATIEQKAAALDSYFHYAGPWHLDGNHVVHAVTMALNPNMAGTDQRRLAAFDGTGGLTLSALEATKDGSRRHILQWIRSA